jgi:hypothetical protein
MEQVDRRTVLGLGTVIGATALLAPFTTGDVAEAATHSPRGLRGRALLPGDPGYAEEIKTYNLTQTPNPGLIIAAETPGDVQIAVRIAAKRRAPVAVLATGHQPSVREAAEPASERSRAAAGPRPVELLTDDVYEVEEQVSGTATGPAEHALVAYFDGPMSPERAALARRHHGRHLGPDREGRGRRPRNCSPAADARAHGAGQRGRGARGLPARPHAAAR